jgi:hypothetical protein
MTEPAVVADTPSGMKRSILLLAVLSGLVLPAAASGTATPVKIAGPLKVTAPSTIDLVHVKFQGTLPTIKNGEYAAYFTTFMGSPAGHCNSLGTDVDASPSRPKRKAVDLDPQFGMLPGNEWQFGEIPNWCAGQWFAQAFVYHKKNGAYHPRVVFAQKTFTIG